jgi:hypothetical protein
MDIVHKHSLFILMEIESFSRSTRMSGNEDRYSRLPFEVKRLQILIVFLNIHITGFNVALVHIEIMIHISFKVLVLMNGTLNKTRIVLRLRCPETPGLPPA